MFDFPSLLIVILLFICAATFTRSLYPGIFTNKNNDGTVPTTTAASGLHRVEQHSGIIGLCWKASRIGERLSPYVAGACVIMVIHLLFIKP